MSQEEAPGGVALDVVEVQYAAGHRSQSEAPVELTRQGGFLGALSLTTEMPEVRRYAAAAQAVCEAMPDCPSIVCTSILSALDGQYGDHHRTARTRGSTLWINPLMAFYWCFRLGPVARRVLYLDDIKSTRTAWNLIEATSTPFAAAVPRSGSGRPFPMPASTAGSRDEGWIPFDETPRLEGLACRR